MNRSIMEKVGPYRIATAIAYLNGIVREKNQPLTFS